ncbi:MAG: glutamate--tRNA ligase [Acidimicrobiia bacterium]|nr:glutamate--tRNA ligase [Acidimicrobiia bacterium]
MIRVRFAPSPTGYLHVGGARTALFNWLLARRHGGVFVLRIEDTDADRSSTDMVEGILDGLRWLGLDWDEGPHVGGPYAPYFQSQRLDRYRTTAERLVAEGHAYYCYCSPDAIKTKREAAERTGVAWRYDRTCLALAAADIAAKERAHQARAVRVRAPERRIGFDDAVHGRIEFDGSHIEDFVILRSDGHPTYHLSVVCDDVEMGITHVVRGDDHVSNTPKQLLLYDALGAPVPRFAHVPLIMGPDKKRLSKRHGATSVIEYARQGYLPEAMVNFLALLGWSPGSGDQELFTRSDLIARFALERISGGNAVFSVEKLDWFNQQYLWMLAPDELSRRVQPSLASAGLWRSSYAADRRDWFHAVLQLLKPRAKKLTDFVQLGQYFFADELVYDPTAVDQHLRAEGARDHLLAVQAALDDLDPFDVRTTEAAVRAMAESRGVNAATLIHALRVALTGRTASPGLFEVAVLLGRHRVLARISSAVALMESSSAPPQSHPS